jgi:predicted Zn-dependent protease with MMP-like domain
MHQVPFEQFEAFVVLGIEAIPEQFRKEMKNVAVTIEDEPSAEQRRKLELRPHHSLLGLYEGVALPKRAFSYAGVLPDKITIFQRPLEWAANSEEELKQMVIDTVWHEFGHHFGLNEDEVRAAEHRRRNHQ